MSFEVVDELPESGYRGRPLNKDAQAFVEAVHENAGSWVALGEGKGHKRTTLQYYCTCFRKQQDKYVKEGYHAEAQIRDYKLYVKVEKK